VARVLLAGESWTTLSVHTKGFDSFVTSTYAEGADDFRAALEVAGHSLVYQPNHEAAERFPSGRAELEGFDVVVLSDIGSNTLLLPAATFLRAEVRPNRLAVLREWVTSGGALAMIGGYLSFQGIEGRANYRSTPLADVLPVELEVGDDRQETPQGAVVQRSDVEHPITKGMEHDWPALLGYQRLVPRPDAEVLATIDGWPLLVVGMHGRGRVLAFASDIGPHWAPRGFVEWPGYEKLWARVIAWLADEENADAR